MTTNYLELARNLRDALSCNGVNYETEGGDKDAITAVYVGRAISVALPLPTSPVPNAAQFFVAQYFIAVKQVISQVNEGMVINTELMYETVLELWRLRYDMVYSPTVFLMYTDTIAAAYPHVLPDRIGKAIKWLNTESHDGEAYAFRNLDRIADGLLNPAKAAMNIAANGG